MGPHECHSLTGLSLDYVAASLSPIMEVLSLADVISGVYCSIKAPAGISRGFIMAVDARVHKLHTALSVHVRSTAVRRHVRLGRR